MAGILKPTELGEGSAYERIEYRLDELIAGYASRYFKGRTAPFVPPTSLKESWKLLGQGFLTVFADILYTYLIVEFVLQFRLLVLLFKSPVIWWRERQARKATRSAAPAPLPEESRTRQLPPASVTEQATERLAESTPARRENA